MKFEEFMDMYDNWNGKTCVNDNSLNRIIEERTLVIMETRFDLFDKEVVAFGFYEGVLTVRLKI